MVNRLDVSALDRLPPDIARPRYSIAEIGIGIVHLGIGAFHRAHQAIYTDDVLAGDRAWGICGVSLRSASVRDRLVPQQGLYTSITKDVDRISRRIVGSVREVLFYGEQHDEVLHRLTAREVGVVSLTVTEKGYCHEPATGRLNVDHPDIVHDLSSLARPRSVVGLLVAAFRERRRAHGAPLTIICCDNLTQNGGLVLGLVMTFANLIDTSLANWISREMAFPSTMVDRIVPATTLRDVDENAEVLGVKDETPVVHEPFAQWVIEDRFAAGRPAWDEAGATFVHEVDPYEAMKLRLLNASHSGLAYLGFLAGYEYIYQVAAQPDFVGWMRRFTAEEVTPTLAPPPGIDLRDYREALVRRFRNPALPHRTQQIAMDGSQKLPQRILGTIRDGIAAEHSVALGCLAVAAWMRYAYGEDEHGRRIDVSDPLAPTFGSLAARHRGDPRGFARSFFALRTIFDEDLHNEPRFTEAITRWLEMLFAIGSAKTVARAIADRTTTE